MNKFLFLFLLSIVTLYASEFYIQLPLTKSTKSLYKLQAKLKQIGLTMRVNKYPQGYAPFVGAFDSKNSTQLYLQKIHRYISPRAKIYTTERSNNISLNNRYSLFVGGTMSTISATEDSNQSIDFLGSYSTAQKGFNIGVEYGINKNISTTIEYQYSSSEISTSHNILSTVDYTLYAHKYFNFDVGALAGFGILDFKKLPVDNVEGDFQSMSPLYGADVRLKLKINSRSAIILNFRPILMQHQLSIQTLADDTIFIKETLAKQFLLRAQYSF